MSDRFQLSTLALVFFVLLGALPASAVLLSYPTSAIDTSGVTGASVVSLGAPDYQFINDSGLGFGGTNTDVFDVGEAVEMSFPVPLRNIPSQRDLIISVFVGGLGATDNANVQVEVSSDGINFVVVATFNTQDARDTVNGFANLGVYSITEGDFEGVKHFFIDFGTEDLVTDIRLTNLAGTAEGFRLDAVEGLHPVVNSTHAFEIRFDRYRPDFNGRFFVRIKNIADIGGVPIREFRMTRSTTPGSTLEDTEGTLFTALEKRGRGIVGESFICVENCIPDNGPLIPFSRHAWSIDGLVEAPSGVGLDPGKQAFHPRDTGAFDTDNTNYLTGMAFRVTFADGLVQDFTYDNDFMQVVGSLYQKYLYFDTTPAESWNRPTDYYQFIDPGMVPVPTLSMPGYWILAVLIGAFSVVLIRVRSR